MGGEAFGPRWAFVAMFMLFIEVSIWFPTVLTFGAVSLAYTGTNQNLDAQLSGNKAFVLAVVLVVYWLATFIAFRGAGAFSKVAQWGGIIGTIIPAAVLIVLGFSYYFAGNTPQIQMGWGEVIPDFTNFSNVVLAASIFLFYAGMEMNAIHVKEVKNPTRDYPIAVLIAALGTVVIFVLGTLAIAFVVPQADINLTQSLLTSYNDMFAWAGIGWAGPIIAAMLLIGVLAGVVTWVAGPSSGLLAVAKAGYLPRFWQHTNKHGMGTHIMFFQAFVVTALGLVYVVLPSVQAAYQILSQLTVILYLIMYMLMFAGAIYLRYSPAQPPPAVPGSRRGSGHVDRGRRRIPRFTDGLRLQLHTAGADCRRVARTLCRHPGGRRCSVLRPSPGDLRGAQTALAGPGKYFRALYLAAGAQPSGSPDAVLRADRGPHRAGTGLRSSRLRSTRGGRLRSGHQTATGRYRSTNCAAAARSRRERSAMMPDKATIAQAVRTAHADHVNDFGGTNASYIPYLASVDPALFGVCVVTADGEVFEAGDARFEFALESISKVFSMTLAMQSVGLPGFHDKVGADPTGEPFNSVIAVALHGDKPVSPLVNAGAMSTVSLIPADSPDERWKKFWPCRVLLPAGRSASAMP
ncbi:amino acid permease [Arthrobacter sp. ATA002]|nr:amino acid permease [Arthrobacter sp. ATA002]WAP53211.1 amino acid permease [Arthrobacter sp. ATA002]